ncbi:PLP-dependent aminotransferase family protein [Gulosibacter sp. 10]|uniref:MocR-like pyridoxine biosynthesis transcription factor PdxR n=1 Tax=Gulosibacter sp. 10 TaxID=1255570 RepID=UPI00097EF396|nr:PLP-dependent aminotransferase family protein [Gulosibacter sp. 10]SJM62563.1 Predicted transcriptional regulator of pyridoxine metabolism [Gulosibacter sp. 10]
MRPASAPELPVALDRGGPLGLPQQLAQAVRALIEQGSLRPGDPLPSTRAWAARLEVSRGTVVAAYEQLAAEGYLVGEAGSATRINPSLPAAHPAAGRPRPANPTGPLRLPRRASGRPAAIDMLPGQPATDLLRTPAWRRAWRTASDVELAPLPIEGDARLRRRIAEHYRRMRGLSRDADRFLVTAGGREGLSLVLQTLHSELRGARPLRVGVESPGYPSLRRAATRLGAELVPLEVDRAGLRTDLLPSGGARPDLAIVTPSHQYPLGGSLPVDRRLELLEWAQREGVLLLEDDYDSELRYVGQPLPTLTALDDPEAGTVALLGTFSKTMAPALGLGMLCASGALRDRLLATRADLGTPVSAVVQHALADYLASGELHRHTARVRRAYRHRRDLVLERLGELPAATVSPMDGGLHAVIRTGMPEEALLDACARARVRVSPGAAYWQRPDTAANGEADGGESEGGSIVIGYAHLADAELREGLDRLRRALG